MCPRNPVTWGTHAYFSHLRRFTGAHRLALWAHKQTQGFCLFVCVKVCVFSTPLSPFLILAIVFSPLPRGCRVSLSRKALGKLFSLLVSCFWSRRNPLYPCHLDITVNNPLWKADKHRFHFHQEKKVNSFFKTHKKEQEKRTVFCSCDKHTFWASGSLCQCNSFIFKQTFIAGHHLKLIK